MVASRSVSLGVRSRVGRLLAVGAVAVALAAGLAAGVAPEPAAAGTCEEIEIIERIPGGGSQEDEGCPLPSDDTRR